MRLLALETSTERLSLAIVNGGEMFAREIDAGQRHSELAIAELKGLLNDAGCTLADLDAIAFGRGPGSFVGVRIACGLAMGLALGARKPLLPVCTLIALAEQAAADRVLVAVDARMGEFYVAAYARSESDAGGWQTVVKPLLARADQLPLLTGTDWVAAGSAFDSPTLKPILAARYSGQLSRVQSGCLPSASQVASVAARRIARLGIEAAVASEPATPLYLRNHVADTIEERRLAKAMKEREQQQEQSPSRSQDAQQSTMKDVAA